MCLEECLPLNLYINDSLFLPVNEQKTSNYLSTSIIESTNWCHTKILYYEKKVFKLAGVLNLTYGSFERRHEFKIYLILFSEIYLLTIYR